MKFVKLSVFALLLLSVACTNDLNDSDSLVNQQVTMFAYADSG